MTKYRVYIEKLPIYLFIYFLDHFTNNVEKGETYYCTGVWKGNWYKMWCNKYKKIQIWQMSG